MSMDTSSLYNYDHLTGSPDELNIMKSIGRQENPPMGTLIRLVNETAIKKLKNYADQEFSSKHISQKDYEWIQSGFHKIQEVKELKENITVMLKTNDLTGMRHYLNAHKDMLSIPDFAQILFEECHSSEMGQILVEEGLNFNKIKKETKESKIRQLVIKKEFALIDLYAQQGFKPLFKMDLENSPTTIEFIGCGKSTTKGSLASYLEFPNIKKALYEFALKEINIKNYTLLELTLNHFSTYGDREGIALIMNSFNNLYDPQNEETKQIIEFIITDAVVNAIERNHPMFIEELLSYIPLHRFTAECQLKLFSAAQQLSFVTTDKLLVTKGIQLNTKNRTYFENQVKWWKGEVLETYPALQSYAPFDRALNRSHWNLYGGDTVQAIFQQGQRDSIIHTLWMLKDTKLAILQVPADEGRKILIESFKKLLTSLGIRRRNTAALCRSSNIYEFGTKRYAPLQTAMNASYQNYNSRANFREKKTEINLDNKQILLSKIKSASGDSSAVVLNEYNSFWIEGDSVFSHVAMLYGNIVTGTFTKAEKLGKEIAKLHWFLAHISPFERGSASISEVITDSLWLFHGYTPQPIEHGKSLDLEAFFAPSIEEFQTLYPLGK